MKIQTISKPIIKNDYFAKSILSVDCGEIFMSAYDACRLMAINLFSVINNPFTTEANLDYNTLYEICYEQQRLADDLVDLELEHIRKIINKINADNEPEEVKRTERELWEKIYDIASSARRTGCGFTGLGDMLAGINLSYDSEESLAVIDRVMKIKMEAELDCTIDLAILRGTFTGWNKHSEYDVNGIGTNDFYNTLKNEFSEQANRMYIHGRRNVSWSTVAPTGTVSLMTQTSSGLEPIFQPYYIRRKKVNPNDTTVRVDFTDQNGDMWMEFPVLHPKFRDWCAAQIYDIDSAPKDIIQSLFEQSPWFKSTANDIDWIKRVEIQGIIQKYTTHSISSTINLPNSATKEDVANIYLSAHDMNLKGVTVYRDGSRTGVLITEPTAVSDTATITNIKFTDAPKRPKTLPCKIHHVTAKGIKWIVAIGMLDDVPYEVLAYHQNGTPYPTADGDFFLTKQKNRQYILHSGATEDSEDYYSYGNIITAMSDEEAALTRMISTALRHGTNIKYVVDQLDKAEGTIISFSKAIARTLKKYITPDMITKKGITCNDCGGDNIILEEGCQKCLDCGNSKCG